MSSSTTTMQRPTTPNKSLTKQFSSSNRSTSTNKQGSSSSDEKKKELSAFWKFFERGNRKRRQKKTKEAIETTEDYNHILEAVEEHFPGAQEGSTTLECVKPVIAKLGLTDDNTLFAQSICPDEINHEEGDIPNLFSSYLGEVFHMGGLAGIPFTGKTGFAAYSHHVPDDGHCFILMAPHIGLSNDGDLGQYSRDGQSGGAGSACGAAVGALGHCCAGHAIPDAMSSFDDPQMSYIIREINARKESILKGVAEGDNNSKQANLARANYDIANTMLKKITSLEFGSDESTLVILTGIQINMPRAFEDYFQPISFEIHRKDGTVTNLFEETFNEKAVKKAIKKKVSESK